LLRGWRYRLLEGRAHRLALFTDIDSPDAEHVRDLLSGSG
jgi:hypothetical protein